MRRPPREVRVDLEPLEGRRLLSAGAGPRVRANLVQFQELQYGSLVPDRGPVAHVVGQDDGTTSVTLTRSDTRGESRVRVTTDPASPAVGVNVAAVDQTITFRNGDFRKTVKVPVLAGASNPGVVDVNLVLTPLSPRLKVSDPLPVRILASDETIFPRVVSVEGGDQAIVLRFNKPMDPATASDPGNYKVTSTVYHDLHKNIGPLRLAVGSWWYDDTRKMVTIPVQSASYDPATRSVTLVTAHPIQYSHASGGVSVTQSSRALKAGTGLRDTFGTSLGGLSEVVTKGVQDTSW